MLDWAVISDIFSNSLGEIWFHGFKYRLYTDDTQMYISGLHYSLERYIWAPS